MVGAYLTLSFISEERIFISDITPPKTCLLAIFRDKTKEARCKKQNVKSKMYDLEFK